MSRKKDLSVKTSGVDALPMVPKNGSTPTCPSPLASASSGARRKSLRVETATETAVDYPPSVFDFTDFSKNMTAKPGVSPPTYSPKSFVQRYDIFDNSRHVGEHLAGGLAGWGNIQQSFLQSSESIQNDLAPYLSDSETRSLVLFHPPGIAPVTVRTACQKYGVLHYLKSNFHSKGVTFFSYFDIRSAISAHARLSKQLSGEGYDVSVQYSIMLGDTFSDSAAKLSLKNLGANVTEAEIQSKFIAFGPLGSIQRKFMVQVDSPTNKSPEEPSLCEFTIEYFNVQDAKKAFDQLNPKIHEQFGSKAELQVIKPSARSAKQLKTLTDLLLLWKASLSALGIDCNSPIAVPTSPKSLGLPKSKEEVLLDVSPGSGSDENSDPSSPCASPKHGKTKLVTPEDQPLTEIAKPNRHVSRLMSGSQYRETELGLVEVTPPASPASKALPKEFRPSDRGMFPVPPSEDQSAQSAEAFHNYRQQLIMEHEKLLKMQEALLEQMPPDAYYPSYQQHYRAGAPREDALSIRNREPDRRYGAREYAPHPQGYPRGAPDRRARGHPRDQYMDGDDYSDSHWSSGHGGYRAEDPYQHPQADPRMRHDGGRWQPGRGGQRSDYGYEYDVPPMDYEVSRGGVGPDYRRPTGARNPHAGAYGGNPSGAYPPYRGSYMPEVDRRYDQQQWIDKEHQEANKANATFVVRVEDVLSGADNRVTIMVKNIPNKYSQSMLLDEINSIQSVSYDFFYLPMDFRNRCNVGYAFINFTDRNDVVVFFSHFHGRKWNHFNSEKVCAVTYARIQGKQSLVMRYQNSSLLDREDSYKPLLFYSRGHPLEGQPEPFPTGQGGNRSHGRGAYTGPH